MKRLSDRHYRDLSRFSYHIDERRIEKDITEAEPIVLDDQTLQKVLRVYDGENGLQMMATIEQDEKGYPIGDTIVLSFAGTDIDTQMLEDVVVSDIGSVIAGLDTPQVVQARELSKEWIASLRNTFPKANFVSTGHSLGGFLALTVAAQEKIGATVFNAPNPNNILTETEEDWLRQQAGQGVINYKRVQDVVGYGGGVVRLRGNEHQVEDYAQGIFEPYNVYVDAPSSKKGLLGAHLLEDWELSLEEQIRLRNSAQKQRVDSPLFQHVDMLGRFMGSVSVVSLVSFVGGMLQEKVLASRGQHKYRDFSDQHKQVLLSLVKERERTDVRPIQLGAVFGITRMFEWLLQAETYQTEIQAYQRDVSAVNQLNRQKIEEIFESVHQIDRYYAHETEKFIEDVNAITQNIVALADRIH